MAFYNKNFRHEEIVKQIIETCKDITNKADELVGDISNTQSITITISIMPLEIATYSIKRVHIVNTENSTEGAMKIEPK